MSAPYQEGGPPSGAPGGKTSLGLESNVGAMLCYIANFLCCIGLVLAIVFLVTEKENRFVKFHALQSLFLALAQIAETLAPRAANVHFEDHIEDGRVVFDYRMRPGVVTKSNALALMRSVGIEV